VVAALTPAPEATPLPGFRPVPPRVALLAGAEGSGLTAAAQDAAHHRLRIPMTDQVDSLNVATAIAVALYHFSEA
jgi:tRNA G18 (ribose-2'-O)-methylase SpoU